jgi:hypothetical protein
VGLVCHQAGAAAVGAGLQAGRAGHCQHYQSQRNQLLITQGMKVVCVAGAAAGAGWAGTGAAVGQHWIVMTRGPLLSALQRSMAPLLHVSLLTMCTRVTMCLMTHPLAWALCGARGPLGSLGVQCWSWSEVCVSEQLAHGLVAHTCVGFALPHQMSVPVCGEAVL